MGVFLAATCSTSAPISACPTPEPGSTADATLQSAFSQARFPLLYPCQLPNSQNLTSASVTGNPGRQSVELVWQGPFDLTVRQSQYPPAVAPDPAGSTRITVDLFSNVKAVLLEVNDGSGGALYHLFWQREGIYYEVQAVGPPLQRRAVLNVATSLSSLSP